MYNKSEIMSRAWKSYKSGRGMVTFAQCLRHSWTIAKNDAKRAASGIVTMHYSEYKNNYASCKTVPGSYDKRAKTIDVCTKGVPAMTAKSNKQVLSTELVNGNDGFYNVTWYTDGTSTRHYAG